MIAISTYLNCVATLPCEIRKFTITAKLLLVLEKLICFTLSKASKVQNMLISSLREQIQ